MNLRIVYVTPRYYPHLGGVEHVVRNFAERLAARGHNVTVITGEPDIKKTIIEEINNVEVVRISTLAPNEAYHFPKDKQKIASILQDNLDIVHTHSLHSAISILPMTIKRPVNWKLIMTTHFSTAGYTFLRRLLWRLAWRRYLANILKSVDLIHATSSFESRMVSTYFPTTKGRIATIPVGIDEDILNYRWKGRYSDYMLYSGRLEKYKQVHLAIKATAHLVKQGYTYKLMITGSGPYKNQLIKISKRELGLLTNRFIIFDSSKSRDEYLETLSNARAAISLSVAENFNLFIAEAYSLGIPIIATPQSVAFCPEIANVNTFEREHVANVMLSVLKNNEKNKCEYKLTMWQATVETLENVYNTLLST
ncbi:MAG: glycosyltransferase family 4 protein [Candidatus Bathyarchaeota archaeon]|nr:glycosyltransferase family 4 protein [Candidatus Bathyarchaeota archaeon]